MSDARNKYKEGRYDLALVQLKKAKELDPDNAAVSALTFQATIAMNQQTHDRHKLENEATFLEALNNDQGPRVSSTQPVRYDEKHWNERARNRTAPSIFTQTKDPVERAIERRLETPESFHWKDTSLQQIIEDLKAQLNINVVLDVKALQKANIGVDQPMSLSVEHVKAKSALNLLLSQAKLTYVIKEQVLQITTEDEAKGKLRQVIHPVADLIVPVENHQTPEVHNLNSALWRHINRNTMANYSGGTPTLPPSSLPFQTGLPAQHYGNTVAQPPPTNPDGATGFMPNPNTKLLKGQTMEHLLMDLIKNTVAQNSWSDVGGPAAIQYYPLGMALIVNQTLEVQEEVAALLQALRRLQDLEVAIEMRLVSVSEAFFERMGLDFDINIRTPHSRHEAQLLSGQFTPFGNINRNLGVRDVVSGMTPAGTLTPDLNIPLKSSSYNFSIPPFGGYPGTIGDAGGISLGLAFLNDIQVFMFLEAAQGDRRTNVMQAPKITLFNGQVSTMTVADNQFFLTDVQLGVPTPPFAGNQLFFIPNQQPYPLGVNLTVSAVVSADRRFVRVNLTPSLTNLASTTVPLFPVSIIVPQFFDGPGNNSSTNTQPQVFQMFFQQPAFTTITMSTTVNVPDGGTVLLGGLKTMSEARNEFGPPILSKIPYVNRLFRNIAYGRESQSLMIMVTPRIIINEEEEQILFGQIQIPRP
jgi:type II secretory pathway component GspD/PulD (secretin)